MVERPVDVDAARLEVDGCRILIAMADTFFDANHQDTMALDAAWLYVSDQLRKHLEGIARALGLTSAEGGNR